MPTWRWICLAPCRPFHPSAYPAVKIVLVHAMRADEREGLGGLDGPDGQGGQGSRGILVIWGGREKGRVDKRGGWEG